MKFDDKWPVQVYPFGMGTTRLFAILFALAVSGLGVIGCQSSYYNAMEAFGTHKRDLLVSRVEDAREEQSEAKTEFKDALTQFTELVNYDGGNLRQAYDKASDQYSECESKAKSVKKRISSIEDVGDALFEEWKKELDLYTSESMKQSSRDQMMATRGKYDEMIAAMKRASNSMDPVLASLNNQRLFLKHTLNAQTVGSLKGEVAKLEGEVATLIQEMEQSIAEADRFIQDMGKAN